MIWPPKNAKASLTILLAIILAGAIFWSPIYLGLFTSQTQPTSTIEVSLKAETLKSETLQPNTPKTATLKTETPKAQTPKVEQPKAETPKVEIPKAEPPKADSPKAEPPKADPPKAEPPKVEPPKVETPKVTLKVAKLPRIIYYSRHEGTIANLRDVAKPLGLTIKVVDPGAFGGLGMEGDRADHIFRTGVLNAMCQAADVIIIGDTCPDARPLLIAARKLQELSLQRLRLRQNLEFCENTKFVVELTTRFDWDIPDNDEYNDLISGLIKHGLEHPTTNNVFWVANNPWEPKYLEEVTGIDGLAKAFRLIRPTGSTEVKPEEVKDTRAVITYSNQKIVDLCEMHHVNITELQHRYGGPHTLKKYKAYVEFPYQVSTMKFYENLRAGVVSLFPTPALLKAVILNDTHGFGPWTRLKNLDNWYEYMEMYRPEFKPYVYYFKSFSDLRDILAKDDIDERNVRDNAPVFYEKIRIQSLRDWASLFKDMGFDLPKGHAFISTSSDDIDAF